MPESCTCNIAANKLTIKHLKVELLPESEQQSTDRAAQNVPSPGISILKKQQSTARLSGIIGISARKNPWCWKENQIFGQNVEKNFLKLTKKKKTHFFSKVVPFDAEFYADNFLFLNFYRSFAPNRDTSVQSQWWEVRDADDETPCVSASLPSRALSPHFFSN